MEPDLDQLADGPAADPGLNAQFLPHRTMLLGLAYRLLGSAWDAEDVLQEAYLRWVGTDRAAVRDPRRYLSRTVVRLAMDQLRRRATQPYVGTWLPEPVSDGSPVLGPMDTVELRESVSLATLHLLERLTPPERAVYLLRVAFEFGYPEIAEILGRGEADCRQLLHRATGRVGDGTARFTAEPAQHAALLRRFLAAARDGDVPGLAALLRDDAIAWGDGGGKVRANRFPVRGRDKVARLFGGLSTRWPVRRTMELRVNGEPAVAIWRGTGPQLWTVRPATGQLTDVYLTLNPDKLRSVPQLWEP